MYLAYLSHECMVAINSLYLKYNCCFSCKTEKPLYIIKWMVVSFTYIDGNKLTGNSVPHATKVQFRKI